MGTTVSSNLGLIKPDGSESIKEDLPTFAGWAAQNEINMDKIDALFRDDVTTSYTVNWNGSGGNPVLGAGGFTEGKYIRLLPRMVMVFFRIFTGAAGFTVGAGNYNINLPIQADPVFATFTDTCPMGKAIYYDVSAALTSSVFSMVYSVALNAMMFRPATGSVWSATVPVVPGQQDRVSGYFMYPTAVV
jgi:hypothetical protein